jgi:ribosome-associated translation inhibitor RaiA
MNKRITFRGMEHSVPTEKHAHEQLAKIEHLLENEQTPIYLNLVLEAGRPHAHHKAELHVKSPHYDIFVEEEGPHLIQIMDTVIDTVYRKMQEKKKQLMQEHRQSDCY